MSEPEWADECRRCEHLRISRNGRLWKCRIRKIGPYYGYCATNRINGICRFNVKANTTGEAALPARKDA